MKWVSRGRKHRIQQFYLIYFKFFLLMFANVSDFFSPGTHIALRFDEVPSVFVL